MRVLQMDDRGSAGARSNQNKPGGGVRAPLWQRPPRYVFALMATLVVLAVHGLSPALAQSTALQLSTDLSVEFEAGVPEVLPGDRVQYTITAANNGPSDDPNVAMEVIFSPQLIACAYVSVQVGGITGNTPFGQGDISDNALSMPSGSSIVYTATCVVDEFATGTASSVAAITASLIDTDPSNNSAVDQKTILVPSADLSVRLSDSADPVLPGQTFRYTVDIDNGGPHPASDVQVVIALPDEVSLQPSSICTEAPAGSATCIVGDIAEDGSAQFNFPVTVAPTAGGVITATATVSSRTDDPVSGNNSEGEDTQVSATQADLSVNLSAAPDPAVAGEALTFTVSLANDGPNAAQQAEAVFTPPSSGVRFVPTSGCVENAGGTISCAFGDVAAGGRAERAVSFTVDLTTTGALSASVTVSSLADDPDLGNNTASARVDVEPPPADLSAGLVGTPDPVEAGGTLTYTISLTNNGPNGRTTTFGSLALPPDATFIPSANCSLSLNRLVFCTFGPVGAGQTVERTVSATVDPDATGTLRALVTVSSVLLGDPDLSNNTAVEQTTVAGTDADLSISLSDAPDPVLPGATLTYTVQLANAGPSEALAPTAVLEPPAGLTFVPTPDCIESSPGSIFCSFGNLASGGTVERAVSFTVDPGASGTLTTDARVVSPTDDPVLGNNTTSEDTTVASPQADLSVGLFDAPDPVRPGETLTYTVRLANAGPQEAEEARAVLAVPAGITLLSAGGCVENGSRSFVCSFGDVPAGGTGERSVAFTVDLDTTGTLSASVSAESPTEDPEPGNNTANASTTVSVPQADLSVSLANAPDPVAAGGDLTYTISIANAGPDDVAEPFTVLFLPAGIGFSNTANCRADVGRRVICLFDPLAAGGTAERSVPVTVLPDVRGRLIASVSVTSNAIQDPVSGNNTDSIGTTVIDPGADLSVSLSDAPDPVLAGGTVIYTVDVANAGPETAVAANATFSLPAGVTLVSTSGCGEDPTGVPTCSLGDLPASGTAQFTVEVAVDAGTSGTITADVTVASDTADSNSADNSASESTTVNAPNADLSVTVSDTADPVLAGDRLVYTVDVANAGPQDAVAANATFTLPAGVTLVATSGCGEDPTGVPTCSLGDLPASGSAQFTVEVAVDAATSGTITADVTVASDTADGNSADNSASESTTVNAPNADLSITIADSPDPVLAGDTLTYTVDVANAGPETAVAANATFSLPAGVTLVATNGCGEDPTGVPTCSLGDLPASGSARFTVEVAVDAATSGTITADVAVASDTADANNANNSASESTTVTGPDADLSVTISDSADPVLAGDRLVYTVDVANAGPQTAIDPRATFTLPAGVTLVATDRCSEDPSGVPTCSLSLLLASQITSFTVEVAVDPATSGTITAGVTVESLIPDGNSADNSASESTTVNAPNADLSVTIADDVDPVLAGGTVVYTVDVVNAGPQDATGTTATFSLPAGVSLVSTSGCGEDPSGVPTCSLGDLPASGSAQFTVEVSVDPATSGTISAGVAVTSDLQDSNSANNSASESTTVNAANADLAARLAVSPGPVIAGEQFSFRFRIDNFGPQLAVGTEATLTVPAGVTLNPNSACSKVSGGVYACPLRDLEAGGNTNVGLSAWLDPTVRGTFTMTLEVSSSVADANPGNNIATQEVSVQTPVADLSLQIFDDADPVPAGGTLTYAFVVLNAGPQDAAETELQITLPDGVTPSPPFGCVAGAAGAVTCALDDVSASGSDGVFLPVTVSPDAVGTLTVSAVVSSIADDSNLGNNAASEETTVTRADGTITIVKNTAPAAAGNDTFTYTSPVPALDGLSLTTTGNTARSPALSVASGSVVVSEAAVAGWVLSEITCEGDLDNETVFDVAAGTVNIDLDGNEAITCTFTSRRDADVVVTQTQRVIRNFISGRMDTITANEPQIFERLKGGGGGGEGNPIGFAAGGRDDNLNMSFHTSVRALYAQARREKLDTLAAIKKSLALAGEVPPDGGVEDDHLGFDIWAKGKYVRVRSGDTRSDVGLAYLGADYRFSRNLVIGLLGQVDWTDETDSNANTAASGFGWLLGPYAAVRLTDNLIFDGRAAMGTSNNKVDPLGLFSDDFETTRWLVKGQLTGDFTIDEIVFNPFISALYFEETQHSFTNTLGMRIPSQTLSLGRIKFGPKVSTRLRSEDGLVFAPHFTFSGIFDFDRARQTNSQGLAVNSSRIRGRAEGGLSVTTPEGWQIEGEGFYDGIGAKNLESFGGGLSLTVPLN